MSTPQSLSLTFLTPDRVILEDVSLNWALLPGQDGDIKVFPNHTPLLLLLREGTVQLQLEEGLQSFDISGGFANILPQGMVLWGTEVIADPL